jgi:hypothetical protein
MSETTTQKPRATTEEELAALVDSGADLSEYIDWSKPFRPGEEPLPVQLTLPWNILLKVEREAQKRGMIREALMEAWIAEKAG